MNIKLKAATDVLAILLVAGASGTGTALFLNYFGFDALIETICFSVLAYLIYLCYQYRLEELEIKEQFKKVD
jgi:hypothetical protein